MTGLGARSPVGGMWEATNLCFSHTLIFLSSLSAFIPLSKNNSPGWCGSVDWVPACEPKGHQFDSQSGHMPGLQARSPVGSTREATTHWCFFTSLSPSLPLYLKINKVLKKIRQPRVYSEREFTSEAVRQRVATPQPERPFPHGILLLKLI